MSDFRLVSLVKRFFSFHRTWAALVLLPTAVWLSRRG